MAEGANFDKDVDASGYVVWEDNQIATGSGAVHSEPLGVYGVLEDVVVLAQIKTEYMVRYDVGQYMIVESYDPGALHERGNTGGGPHDDPRPRDV